MKRLLLLVATAAVLGASSTQAGDLRVGTQNMKLAMELCLRNYPSKPQLPDVFTRAGFTLTGDADAGSFEFSGPRVFGGFTTGEINGFCYVQSQDVPLALAEEMGLRTAQALFPGKVELGAPERNVNTAPQPCEGLHIFAPRLLIVITYSAAGNSGECLNDGTSAIAIKM